MSTTVDELDTVVDVDVSTTVDELDTVVDVDVDVDVDEPATDVDVDVDVDEPATDVDVDVDEPATDVDVDEPATDVDVSRTVDELDTVVDVDVDVSTTVDELDGTDVFSAVRSKISAHIYPVKDSRLTSTDSARATGENAKTELSIPTITNKFMHVRAPFRLNLF